MVNQSLELRDFGERRLVREVLGRRYGQVAGFGDDAATLVALTEDTTGTLVVTTDPCPPPMAAALGATDLYFAGWLLGTLNLSDLASAGAEPLGLVTSLILPADTKVADFERLLDGVDDCCAAVGTRVVGGNLKESKAIDFTATAVGLCRSGPPLTRRGGRVGDAVVVLGDLGAFWAGSLGVRKGLLGIHDDSPLLKNVLTPLPKNTLMVDVFRRGLLTASIDNSDGIYPSLAQLAAASHVRVQLRSDWFVYRDSVLGMARALDVEPVRLALGWGDWQIIASCPQDDFEALKSVAMTHGVDCCQIGTLEDGDGVYIDHQGMSGPLMALDSERFTRESWFTAGLEAYVQALLEAPIVQR